MGMSNKNYNELAKALKAARPRTEPYDDTLSKDVIDGYNLGAMQAWQNTVNNLVRALSDENIRFSPDRFRSACGFLDGNNEQY